MRSTLFAALVASGLVAACSQSGGVAVDATLDKSSIRPETTAPVASGAGITVVTADWRTASDVVDCVSQTMAKAKPAVRVLPAKDFPNSIYRWDAAAIADLQRLAQQPAAKAEIAAGNVRYVVVIDVATNDQTDNTPDSPCIFTCGKRSDETAKVWDIAAGTEIAEAWATASGRAVAPTAPFLGPLFPLWFDPATEAAACEGIGRKLADYFAATAPPAGP